MGGSFDANAICPFSNGIALDLDGINLMLQKFEVRFKITGVSHWTTRKVIVTYTPTRIQPLHATGSFFF